ncbi:hypothetical protein [Streptomyces sp. NPDC055400]
MGYELHMTRASDWLDSEERPILSAKLIGDEGEQYPGSVRRGNEEP